MKHLFFLFFFVAGLFIDGNTQGNVADAILPGKPLMATRETKYSGSPYLTDAWSIAKVILKNGSEYNNVRLKYNLIEDELIFESQGVHYILDAAIVREFSFTDALKNNVQYTFRNGYSAIPEYNEDSYFEVIFNGKIKLLRKYVKRIVNDPTAAYGSRVNKVLQDQQILFYVSPQGSTSIFRKSKKDILKLFPGNEKEIELYISKNGLDVKNEHDLRLIFEYISTLI